MKSFTALSALIAVAAAQTTSIDLSEPTQSLDIEPTPTSSSFDDIDVEPTTTQTVSGPIETSQACGQIADFVANTYDELPIVDIELAYACLKSMPFKSQDASTTVDEIKKMIQFQSTISYLKDPPQGWPNEAVDLVAGLDDIKSKINDYSNEFDFETDIAALMVKAHDGHLAWNGMASSGAFRWRRSSNIALISASRDGSEVPKIWAIQDFNGTDGAYDPSPITQIDGKDAVQFLNDEAKLNAYHDPDARFNAMFFMQPAESFGYFTSPRFYPGATTNVTYENGTIDTYDNGAIVLQSETWPYIDDAASFYEMYVVPKTISLVKKRDPNALPLHLENPRDQMFRGSFAQQRSSVPLFYPDPVVAHSADLVPLAGYFIDTSEGQIGVLVVQTFNTEDVKGAVEFQAVVQEYISQAKSRGVEKHIIDIRTNGGGKVLSGYDMYLQFFPTKEPQTQSRYRGHQASELFGDKCSSYKSINTLNAELFTSPFSNDAYLTSDLQEFSDWKAMYPPSHFQNDKFTSLLKYNLSDPYTTSNTRLAVGITLTGYGNRSNFTEDPFRAEDIIILSDGMCASTCSIFTELMVQQSGVRSIAVGGRPQLGPMVTVGGTKGTLVLPSLYMEALSTYITASFSPSNAQKSEWAGFLPAQPPIAVMDASVNFQDNIRAGLESAGVPTQFLNDTASCRMWYEPEDFLNVTRLWEKTAQVAFGNAGKMDDSRCVAGSVTSLDQQTGKGESNPSTTGDGGKEDAASGLRVGWMGMVGCAVAVAVSFLLM